MLKLNQATQPRKVQDRNKFSVPTLIQYKECGGKFPTKIISFYLAFCCHFLLPSLLFCTVYQQYFDAWGFTFSPGPQSST